MTHSALRVLLLILLSSLFLSACAPQKRIRDPLDGPRLWTKYLNEDQEKPYRLNLSARFGAPNDSRRMTALLWGNTTETIRLDVLAGVGAVVAKIYQDPKRFLLYTPMEKKAYFSEGSEKPRLKLGIPLPISLQNMADLLTNHPSRVFGERYAACEEDKMGMRYALTNSLQGVLTLDDEGRAVFWRERGAGWTMRIEYKDNFPQKLTLTNAKNEQAILTVREHHTVAPYGEENLTLSLPEGTPLLPLKKLTAKH